MPSRHAESDVKASASGGEPKPKETPAKDIEIMHPKLGKVKIGDISQNEKCRMIRDLLVQSQNLNSQLYVANKIFEELKVGDLNDAKQKAEEKLRKEQEARNVVTKKSKPADS